MSYLVLARKYRPATFDEVVEQSHVTQTLINAISSGRVAHAILFAGPRGTGKTTVARILAKALNCIKGPSPIPCNKCKSCKEISHGTGIDVLEIDGASNNGVEQIRELRENVKYMPAYSRYKIYIIDEVHMLTPAAFNALLKTLEEPPPHIIFLFATTEPHKIPITILSRCQRHDLKRINLKSITDHLSKLCKKEKIDVDYESLFTLAREGGGSMRDALSLLDQVLVSSDKSINQKQILEILGAIDRQYIFELSYALIKGSVSDSINILDNLYDNGNEIKSILKDIIEHFRNLLLVKSSRNIDKLINLPEYEIELMKKQIENISFVFINQIIDILFKQETAIYYSNMPKIALEMAFVKIASIKPAFTIDELIEKIDHLTNEIIKNPETTIVINQHKDEISTKQNEQLINTIQETQNSNDENLKYVNNVNNDIKHSQTFEKNNIIEDKKTINVEKLAEYSSEDSYEQTINKILSIFTIKSPSIIGILKSVKFVFSKDEVILKTGNDSFVVQMLSHKKNILEKVFTEFFKKQMSIKIEKDKNDVSNAEKRKIEMKKENNIKYELSNHEKIKDICKMFNGEIVDVSVVST